MTANNDYVRLDKIKRRQVHQEVQCSKQDKKLVTAEQGLAQPCVVRLLSTFGRKLNKDVVDGLVPSPSRPPGKANDRSENSGTILVETSNV